jgi:hypothetical protein
MNPLVRALAAVAGAFVLAVAFFFGLFVFVLVLGLLLLLWLALWARAWWLTRRSGGHAEVSSGEDVIDAEYHVVSRRDDD